MHWPIALCIGIEVAMDDMDRFDGGDSEESEQLPAPAIPHRAEASAWLLLRSRLQATAATLDAMRAQQQRRPALIARLCTARRRYQEAA